MDNFFEIEPPYVKPEKFSFMPLLLLRTSNHETDYYLLEDIKKRIVGIEPGYNDIKMVLQFRKDIIYEIARNPYLKKQMEKDMDTWKAWIEMSNNIEII